MHSSFSRARLTLVALLGLATLSFAQRPPAQPNAAEILHKMQKLNVLGSVLYIAAHPDDENTRLIAWLSNGKKVRTGYLSLTRGDGGQNLIGPELGDALGIIRTQELLEARRIDGGEQFFTRAVDFGYSKSAEESFEKWGKQEVLSDVVRVIRTFRPDVIITRFPTDGGGGHGHHTASAILAAEAFDLAGDPKAFPEQLQQGLEVWQPRRLFFNGSSWWRKDVAELAKTDPDWFSVDVGGYDPLLGLSYTEVAGRSRSMHKSQGFGAAETRGEMLEYLHLEKGDKPKTKDIFEGIDMTWGRVEGGKHIGPMLASLFSGFEPAHPENSIQQITQSYKAIGGLTERDDIAAEVPFDVWHWVNWSGFQLNMLAENCFGVSSEALTTQSMYSTNDSMNIHLRCLPRTSAELSLSWGQKSGGDVQVHPVGVRPLLDTTTTLLVAIPSQPFWLEKPHDFLFNVAPEVSTLPVVEPSFALACFFKVPTTAPGWSNATFVYNKWVDRVDGERIRPVYVTPVASVIPKTNVLIARGGPQQVEVEVEALTDSLSGQLNVTLPEGWATTKDLKLVSIPKRNARQSFTFQLIPMENAKGGAVKFEFSGSKGKSDRTLHEIDYPHILPQVYYTPAEVKVITLDVKVSATHVGYIKGAGDEVAEAIEQLGATVDVIEPSTATLESITKYDAIVVGIRAYNNNQGMKAFNPTLMEYVENGGTVVVQYTTRTSDMVLPDSLIGPYPFKLTRDRVTVEEAPPTFLAKDHPLLNTPNKITTADFDGWVQERGLYFCGSLDPHYTPLIAWNDPGEQPLNGGLIACDYGKGRYVYTGISFFRQLPAGIPGAYRLFANLISKREP
ncbi:MAG: PIG-L family deacetylase [Flavobacteriales bacterium]|nr:PIG-L family deacetylase [Flavobacteriales bacterium]MBK9077024.1 PIG-L family deacetylase [Flavobacteriales bacterium]MBK9538445.1 PIG-L family deacetylase [Flavobacteriales bacterium]